MCVSVDTQDRQLSARLPELPSDDRLFSMRRFSSDLSELQSAPFIVTTPCWFSESVQEKLHKMDHLWLFSHSCVSLSCTLKHWHRINGMALLFSDCI